MQHLATIRRLHDWLTMADPKPPQPAGLTPMVRGKGKLLVGSTDDPFDAYYELVLGDAQDQFRVTGMVLADPDTWPQRENGTRTRLLLSDGSHFDFEVKEFLQDRAVAGMVFTGPPDSGPAVASVVGSISSALRLTRPTYLAWEDLFEEEMPWLGESGRNRVRASALTARAVFHRGITTGELPPDGLKGSEVLPSQIHEGIYDAVACEFQKSSKLTPCVCEDVIPQIVHLILRLADSRVWEPIPFTIALWYMRITIDKWHARCLREAADLSDSERERGSRMEVVQDAGIAEEAGADRRAVNVDRADDREQASVRIEQQRPISEPKTPILISFADLSVRFTSDFQIELSWGDHREMATYGDLGLADRRGKSKPSKAWQDLRRLARESFLKPPRGPERHRLANRFTVLRKAFVERLNLNDDPFPFDKGQEGYTAAFKSLTPPPDR